MIHDKQPFETKWTRSSCTLTDSSSYGKWIELEPDEEEYHYYNPVVKTVLLGKEEVDWESLKV